MIVEPPLKVDGIYEERIVAFLDILGFSSLVEKSADDIVKQLELYDFLKKYSKHEHAREVFSGFRRGDGNVCANEDIEDLRKFYDYQFTQFSDSFVFSVNAKDRASVQFFPILVGQFMRQALELGFLVRGGIAKGPMVHEEIGPAFGPALIQAYLIESGQAVFGRTVLSKEAFDFISKSGQFSSDWIERGFDDEWEITIASYIKQIFSSSLGEAQRVPSLKDALQRIEQILGKLKPSEQDRVGGKYRYVICKLHHAIEEASN